jgi:adenylate cyclase
MADREFQRRLAAILAADVAAYTRLMEEDSEGTVAAWQDARENVIKPQVADHSGKFVKLTGDGFLVKFPTVQDAVNCAIAMQGGLAPSSLDFRMGVNMGDIIDDGEDIHGEGIKPLFVPVALLRKIAPVHGD